MERWKISNTKKSNNTTHSSSKLTPTQAFLQKKWIKFTQNKEQKNRAQKRNDVEEKRSNSGSTKWSYKLYAIKKWLLILF